MTEERKNRQRLGLVSTIGGHECNCSGTRPDKPRKSPWQLTQLNGEKVLGLECELKWVNLDTPNPSKVVAFYTVLRKNRVWLWTVTITGDILTEETAWREASDIDHISPFEVRFSDGRKIKIDDSFKVRHFDGFEFQTDKTPCVEIQELKPSEYQDNPRLLDVIDRLPQMLGDEKQPPEQIGTDILPGWKRGKLALKSVPNGKVPAVFILGRTDVTKPKAYTVPSGKAWDTVCALIRADAFDGHGLQMPSPSAQFKRLHRPFFSDRMGKNGSGWFIKTV